MRYVVLSAVLCGLAMAYLPSSFRMQSTAGIWPDDYDLLFEPARIPLTSGNRVYSGLSNLVTATEEQFGSARSNFVFVGGSTSLLGPFYPGLLYDRHAEQTPLFTGLVPAGGDSLFGSGRIVNSELRDLDSNGTYDFKSERVEEARAMDEQTDADYHLGIGYRTGSLRLGAAYTRDDSRSASTSPSLNYRSERRDSSLIDNRLVFHELDSASGTDEYGQTSNRLTLNGWYDLASVKVGLLGAFTLIDRTTPFRSLEYGWVDRSPADPTVIDYVHTMSVDSSDVPAAGNRIGGMLSVFHLPTAVLESRYYVSAYTQSLVVADDAGGRSVFSADSVTHPGYDTASRTADTRSAGTYAARNLDVRTRQLFRVSERFRVGFGLGLSMTASEDSLVDSTANHEYLAHNNGDLVPGAEDYRSVKTWSEMWTDHVTRAENVLSLPLGVEFTAFSPVDIRLGVNPTVTWHDETHTRQLGAFTPMHTRVDYGDGSFSETIGDAPSERGTSETRTSKTYATVFSYGLGYRPVENLQIDLMGFARLTDLTNWRLSATLRF